MKGTAVELLVALAELAVYALGAVVLTAFGLVTENTGVQTVTAGEPVLGLWMVGLGAVALVGAYLVTTDRFLPRLRTLRAAGSG